MKVPISLQQRPCLFISWAKGENRGDLTRPISPKWWFSQGNCLIYFTEIYVGEIFSFGQIFDCLFSAWGILEDRIMAMVLESLLETNWRFDIYWKQRWLPDIAGDYEFFRINPSILFVTFFGMAFMTVHNAFNGAPRRKMTPELQLHMQVPLKLMWVSDGFVFVPRRFQPDNEKRTQRI